MVAAERNICQRQHEADHRLQVQRVRGAVPAVEGPMPLVRRLEHVGIYSPAHVLTLVFDPGRAKIGKPQAYMVALRPAGWRRRRYTGSRQGPARAGGAGCRQRRRRRRRAPPLRARRGARPGFLQQRRGPGWAGCPASRSVRRPLARVTSCTACFYLGSPANTPLSSACITA